MHHENLWAPWRMAYLRELKRKEAQTGESEPKPSNFFEAYWSHPELDHEHHVIHRDEHGMILLNRYPYANGHLLVALGEPRPTLMDYDPAQRAAFWSLVELGVELVERTLRPQGINMGINQGAVAGAGVPEHLHMHLVPRWGGDTNFISVVGTLRVMPDALESMAADYRETLNTLLSEQPDEPAAE